MLVQQLATIIQQRITTNRLVLPTMPATAQRCLALLHNPQLNLKQVSSALERDPMLTAQVIRLANTAAYGAAGAAIRSIEQAVTRLGTQKLKNLLVEVSTRQLYETSDHRIAMACRAVWDHSIAVALLARDVAAVAGAADPDLCYLAGLLHDVGKPIAAAMLLEAERSIGRSRPWLAESEWIQTVQETHRPIGVALAAAWGLPDVVAAAIRECNEYDAGDRVSPVNLVRFANAVVKLEGLYVGTMDQEDVGALVLIGRSLLGLDEDVVSRLAGGLRERVRAQG